jgi:hypothetical protein
METLVPTLIGLALMAGVVLVFRLMVRSPRGLSHEDPPGIRSVAVFRGDDPEFFREDREEEPFVGVRLFQQLCDGLAAAGVAVEQRGPIRTPKGPAASSTASRSAWSSNGSTTAGP